MFNSKKMKELQEKNEDLRGLIKRMEQENSLRRATHESEERIREAEINTRIIQATEEKTRDIARLELEKGILAKEVQILNKAFGNMGFDVKDMKSILEKLVDGIVAKNGINVIKSS
jgi:uncharacterized protein (UPF0335 family)